MLPCKNCITLAMCRNRMKNTTMFDMLKFCSYLYIYLKYNSRDDDSFYTLYTSEYLDAFHFLMGKDTQ